MGTILGLLASQGLLEPIRPHSGAPPPSGRLIVNVGSVATRPLLDVLEADNAQPIVGCMAPAESVEGALVCSLCQGSQAT